MATITELTRLNLMMASAILDDVQFNSILTSGFNSTKRYVMAETPWLTLNSETEMKYAINGVDIDWNEASWSQIPGSTVPTTIKTTGELLKAIKYASLSHPTIANSFSNQTVTIDVTPNNPLVSITIDKNGHILSYQTTT